MMRRLPRPTHTTMEKTQSFPLRGAVSHSVPHRLVDPLEHPSETSIMISQFSFTMLDTTDTSLFFKDFPEDETDQEHGVIQSS